MLFLALALTITIAHEFVRKIRYKRRVGVKLAIFAVLLLNCISTNCAQSLAFILNNSDAALQFFYYGSTWLQGLVLALVLHYYSRKWVKLTNNEQHVKWLRMLLGVYLVGLTALFVVGTTKIVEESDSLGCQCNTLL